MNKTILKKRDEREMEFVGELISGVEKELNLNGEFMRKINLAVYAVDGGGFVAEARFQSTNPEERSFSELEDMDSFDDVDKFFYVFDLHENLCNVSGPSRVQREECNLLAKRLVKEYEKVLYPFLEEVKNIVQTNGILDRQKEVRKSRFWNPFKSPVT